mgnify:CR=1 FL=1
MARALTVLVATRNEEPNLERCLRSLDGLGAQIVVLDSESSDRTVEIAQRYGEVRTLAYDHSRIIPWIFQWALDNLDLRGDWILILEADQALTPELRAELAALLARDDQERMRIAGRLPFNSFEKLTPYQVAVESDR